MARRRRERASKLRAAQEAEPPFGDPQVAKACVDALGRHIDRLLSSLAASPGGLDRIGRHAAALGLHRLARYVAERGETISAATDHARPD